MISVTMNKKFSLTQKAWSLFGVILLVQLIYLGALAALLEQSTIQIEKISHSRRVVGNLALLSHSIQDMAILTAVQVRKKSYDFTPEETHAIARIPKTLDKLKVLLKDDPDLFKFDELRESYEELIVAMENVRSLLMKDDRKSATPVLMHIHDISIAITFQLEEMSESYRRTEEDTANQLQNQSKLLTTLSVGLGFIANALVALLLYYFFVTALSKQLGTVAKDVEILASGQKLPEPESGDDTIMRLSIELRRMAAALEEQRSKVRTILDNAANVICSVDSSGVIVTVSPTSLSIWGYPAEELIGKKLISIISPDDAEDTVAKLENVFTERTAISFENRLRKKSGETIELAWKARLADPETAGAVAVCVAQDVTEHNAALRTIKQKEEELRGILERMPIAVVTCDKTFTIASINAATSEIFSFQPQELLGKSLSVLLSGGPISRAADIENFDAIVTKARSEVVELRAWKKDKNLIPVELKMSMFPNRAGETYLATFRDITARMEIELVKQDFVSMISHDLRSPLTSLHATLGLMLEQEALEIAAYEPGGNGSPQRGDSPLRNSLRRSENLVADLVTLINDFLDLEKFEAGRVQLELVDVKLGNIIDATIDRVENIQRKSFAVSVNSTGLQSILHIDQERIIHALTNLFSLVLLFSPDEGEPKILVETTSQSTSVFVTHSHLVIPPEVKENCFKRYALVSYPLASMNLSGLAINLAKSIIEAHGGFVGIVNRSGRDLLWIELPISTKGDSGSQ